MRRKPLWFDITLFCPEYAKVPFRPIAEKNQRLYRHINFMCHILWDVPMWIALGNAEKLAKRILANVTRPDWPLAFEQVGGENGVIATHLHDMQAIVSKIEDTTGKKVTVASLYTEDARSGLFDLVEACLALRNALVDPSIGMEICIPFLFLQGEDRSQPAPGPFVDAQELRKHLPHIAAYTLRDLFVARQANFSPQAIAAIRFFRDNGILNGNNAGPIAGGSPSSTDYRILPDPPSNGFCCFDGVCEESSADRFCVSDLHGFCSAMSDECTPP